MRETVESPFNNGLYAWSHSPFIQSRYSSSVRDCVEDNRDILLAILGDENEAGTNFLPTGLARPTPLGRLILAEAEPTCAFSYEVPISAKERGNDKRARLGKVTALSELDFVRKASQVMPSRLCKRHTGYLVFLQLKLHDLILFSKLS